MRTSLKVEAESKYVNVIPNWSLQSVSERHKKLKFVIWKRLLRLKLEICMLTSFKCEVCNLYVNLIKIGIGNMYVNVIQVWSWQSVCERYSRLKSAICMLTSFKFEIGNLYVNVIQCWSWQSVYKRHSGLK